MSVQVGTLFSSSAPPPEGERFETILRHRNLQVERIVSSSDIQPTEYLLEQDEWVALLHGEATLRVGEDVVALRAGNYIFLPVGMRHAVEKVSDGAVWLAVHLHPGEGAAPGA